MTAALRASTRRDDDAQDDGGDADNTFIEDFDGFDSFDEDDGFDDEIDRDGF